VLEDKASLSITDIDSDAIPGLFLFASFLLLHWDGSMWRKQEFLSSPRWCSYFRVFYFYKLGLHLMDSSIMAWPWSPGYSNVIVFILKYDFFMFWLLSPPGFSSWCSLLAKLRLKLLSFLEIILLIMFKFLALFWWLLGQTELWSYSILSSWIVLIYKLFVFEGPHTAF